MCLHKYLIHQSFQEEHVLHFNVSFHFHQIGLLIMSPEKVSLFCGHFQNSDQISLICEYLRKGNFLDSMQNHHYIYICVCVYYLFICVYVYYLFICVYVWVIWVKSALVDLCSKKHKKYNLYQICRMKKIFEITLNFSLK